ncbi:MAG: glycine cleavage system protein GcvH [Proteobacteria bacterium]|nr:glycine cleavage system protein GcvH [Pseudomonadota bacterium]
MKEIAELFFPEDLRYAEDHEWIKKNGDNMKIGISDYAQDQLGDIVFVELPEVGDIIERTVQFGTVESVKAVSELLMPVGGEIVAVNTSLQESPELVNSDPYDNGWMIEVNLGNPTEYDELMDKDGYLNRLKGSA